MTEDFCSSQNNQRRSHVLESFPVRSEINFIRRSVAASSRFVHLEYTYDRLDSCGVITPRGRGQRVQHT
jgi:hypothetical protein